MGDDAAGSSFDPGYVGTYSCHGQEPVANGSEAKINQDCACMGQPFACLPGTAAFFLYDGHVRAASQGLQNRRPTFSPMPARLSDARALM